MSERRTVMLRTRDPVVERRVTKVAERLGAQALQVVTDADDPASAAAIGLLIELELEGAVDVVRAWRAAHPKLTIVGYLATPEPELWKEAESAGADLVTNRGLADRELERLVDDSISGRKQARRIRIAPLQDFAGRLGHVGVLEETPVGPLALYHVGGKVCAIADACPHAGASLREGALEGDVLTCPRHGSQFRVTDGERLRGPADLAVASYSTVVEGGDVFLELPEV